MQGCYYDCVNGQLVLLIGNCSTIPCAQTAGPCNSEGVIVYKKCTSPI